MSIANIARGGIVPGYFSEENIQFIINKCTEILRRNYTKVGVPNQTIVMERSGVIRRMQTIHEEMRETIPKMNQRVIMSLTNDYRNYQVQRNKHFSWEENYESSQLLFDEVSRRGPFVNGMKKGLTNQIGKVNHKLEGLGFRRFYFT